MILFANKDETVINKIDKYSSLSIQYCLGNCRMTQLSTIIPVYVLINFPVNHMDPIDNLGKIGYLRILLH